MDLYIHLMEVNLCRSDQRSVRRSDVTAYAGSGINLIPIGQSGDRSCPTGGNFSSLDVRDGKGFSFAETDCYLNGGLDNREVEARR